MIQFLPQFYLWFSSAQPSIWRLHRTFDVEIYRVLLLFRDYPTVVEELFRKFAVSVRQFLRKSYLKYWIRVERLNPVIHCEESRLRNVVECNAIQCHTMQCHAAMPYPLNRNFKNKYRWVKAGYKNVPYRNFSAVVGIILILWHTGFTGSQYTGSNGYNFEFWIMRIRSLAYDIFPSYNIGTPINIHIALHKTTIHSSVWCTSTLNAFQHALHCFLMKERKYWRFPTSFLNYWSTDSGHWSLCSKGANWADLYRDIL